MPDGLTADKLIQPVIDAYHRMTMTIAELAAEDEAATQRFLSWVGEHYEELG